MLKYASLMAPLVVGASKRSSVSSSIANLMLAYGLILVGVIFGMASLYIWAESQFGTLIACVIMSITLLSIGAIILLTKQSARAKRSDVPASVQNDPLAQYIPNALKDDPRVQKILEKIGDNPLAATAGAVTLGMIISRELAGD